MSKLVVLVVDDDKLNLKVVDGYIKQFFPEFSVLLCQKPKEVMGILEKVKVDIVLLDIVMPELSGIELLKKIRSKKKYQEIQVIMLTSLYDAKSFMECFDNGANDYLSKPIDTVEFKARVSSAANTRNGILILEDLYSTVKQQNRKIKDVNTRLKEAQFHLIQSEKLAAIGELAAGVAHEINNPIGYVASNLETMEGYSKKMKNFIKSISDDFSEAGSSSSSPELTKLKEAFEVNYKKYKIDYISEDLDSIISDLKVGVSRVAEIVKALRNFARTENEDEKSICSLKDIIKQALLIVRNESKYTTDIVLNINDDYEVYCHRGQISQVFVNIIINAVQAIKSQKRTENGKINIDVSSNKKYVCIRISDDGPGIPEENLSKIFNPFFTTKDVGQGTGLGLSISYDIIVNKHGGILDVESNIGVGSSFTIKLPLKK